MSKDYGRFTWFELVTTKTDDAKRFYTETLGWKTADGPIEGMDYTLFNVGDGSVGGMQLPQAVTQACFLWFQAANIGTAAYPFLTIANANLLLAHGSVRTTRPVRAWALWACRARWRSSCGTRRRWA